MRNVLIIEDDRSIADLLEIHLGDLECKTTAIYDGKDGLNRALINEYDLIVLDLMLPGIGGIDICKEIRRKEIYTPVLMLTSKSEEFDKVLGLEVGADDYLTKPFSIREFIARVKAIFRRVDAIQKDTDTESDINFGNLRIEVANRKVLLNDERIEYNGYEHTVNSHINRLRSKIEDNVSKPKYILTSWGVGYRFSEDEK